MFISKMTLNDLTSRGIDHEMVWVDSAGDDGLTQAGAGIDDGLASFAGQWIRCEEDS